MSDALNPDMLQPASATTDGVDGTPPPPDAGDGTVSGNVVPSETSVTIRFTGDQGIAEAEATRDVLRQAFSLAGQRRVVIDCDDIVSADLTFIQLLIAARKSGERMGREVVLSRPARGVLAAALAAGGLALPAGEGRGWLNPFWAGE